ncbi:hypothetical protein JCM9533A_29300 [Catenuloplanes niger JCM 9533]
MTNQGVLPSQMRTFATGGIARIVAEGANGQAASRGDGYSGIRVSDMGPMPAAAADTGRTRT